MNHNIVAINYLRIFKNDFFINSYLFLSTLRPRIRPKISIVILVPFLNIIIDTTMPNPPSILHSKNAVLNMQAVQRLLK